MTRALVKTFWASLVYAYISSAVIEGTPYAGSPQLLSTLISGKDERLRMRLSAPIFGGSSAVDIATAVLQSLPSNISEACANQSSYMLGHMDAMWALQMLDAMGKPAAGILEGNALWFGDFDECIAVGTGDNTVPFTGQYCLISYPFQVAGRPVNLQVGSCVPSGCSSADATALFNTVLVVLKVQNVTGFTADCHQSSRPYSTGTYVAIVVCSIFAAFLIIGTLYDVAKTVYPSMEVGSGYEILHDEGKIVSVNKSATIIDETTSLTTGKPKSSTTSDKRTGDVEKFILSFSSYANGKKLLSTAQSEGALGCIHGIRFLSMTWVILGHTYVFSISLMSDPAQPKFLLRRSFEAIFNASVSVDTFFVLSGLLVTYLLLKQLEKTEGHLKPKEWGLIYLHRYIRLTPVYIILLIIWTFLANHFYDGPLWPTQSSFDTSCETYWWTNILYVNNFIPSSTIQTAQCMGWSWYLANDMQFFILTPPLVYLMYRKWYVGVGTTSLLIVGSVGAAAGVSVSNSFTFSSSTGDFFDDYYIKPWCRFTTYGVGVLLGYIIFKRKDKAPPPLSVVLLGWAIAAASCLAVIYGPYDATFGSRAATATIGEAAANNSLSRLAWAAGLSWLIFACSTGCGGWINSLLSWKAFIPLGRLTYCAYLVHPILLTVATGAERQTLHFDDITMTLRFLGILVVSLALAFVTSLAFEAPVIGVERLLLRPAVKNK